MNKVTIETLLNDFVSASTEIQGAVMVSPQGQLLTHPIGLSETSTSIMAGSMLQLAGCVSEQCHWNAVDWVTIQALEGYLILTQCLQDIFYSFDPKMFLLAIYCITFIIIWTG